jgi:CheY-like chemotaxis protein
MVIRFSCPCGQKLKTRDGTEGRHARCSNCLSLLRVPADGTSTYETVAEPYAPHDEKAHSGDAPPAAAAAPEAAAIPADAEFGKIRVLVADSNAEDRRKIARILQDHNYVVLEAADGPKALEVIRAERPSAALLNVKLDIMSGFQVVQQLRSPANALNKDVWDMPVLMTTERLIGRDKQYSMSIGAHGYFVKPLQPAQICPKLEKIASKYHPH